MPRLIERWRDVLNHPIVRLELRRIRRKRWWPRRRFFLFYPVLLGAALGCGVTLAAGRQSGAQLAALVTGAPALCLLNVITTLLAFALTWVAPALAAISVVRERELGTLDVLRATLLTERSIVLGKWGGCLARLWPGILALALLTPFHVLGGTGSIWAPFPPALTMALASGTGSGWPWAELLLSGVSSTLRPWGDLAFHTAIGLFVSVHAHSSGASVAISYAVIIVARLGRSLLTSLFVALALLPGMQANLPEATWSSMLMVPSLASLAAVLLEFAGAALLAWGAVRRLTRQ